MNRISSKTSAIKLIECSSTFYEFTQSLGHPITKSLKWGSWQRFNCAIHNSKNSASYKIFQGTSANGNTDWGYFNCFRCQTETFFWSSKNHSELTEEQKAHFKEQIEKQRLAEKKKAEKSIEEARNTWLKAKSADVNSYIKKKNVIPYGVKELHGTLLIPIYDQNNCVINLEKIWFDENGRKCIGRITGASTHGVGVISLPKNENEIIYLGEGFATMATVHEATGSPSFFSFGAGNLKRSYDLIKAKYKNKVVIIADNNSDQTGEKAARKVAEYILSPVQKDFNDYFIQLINKGMSRMKALKVIKGSIEDAKIPFNYIEFPDMGSKGPLATIENTKALLAGYGITLKFNEMKYRREIKIPETNLNPTGLMNDQLTYICSLAAKHGLARAQIDSHLDLIAGENRYHPIEKIINETIWDHSSRLGDFINTLKVVPEQEELKVIVLRKWLMQGIKSILSPTGYANQIVLMLYGAQGLGKTSWCREFFSTLDLEATMTDFSLDPNKKDDVMRFYEYAFVEIGEAELTINKSKIAGIKRILTSNVNQERKAFARHDSLRFRRSFVVATVNQEKCLVDETGNRRFAPIEVTEINYSYSSRIDMAQLLAEIAYYLHAGESEIFTKQEMDLINSSNKNFEMKDPIEEMILERFDFEAYMLGNCQTVPMTISKIFTHLPSHSGMLDNKTHARIGKILRGLLKDKPLRKTKGMVYSMPPLSTKF